MSRFITPIVAAVILAGCLGSSETRTASGVFAITPEWTFETNETIISTPLISGDTLIVRTESKVYALDASTRGVRWSADSPGSIYDTAPPLITDGVVIVPEGSNPVAAFDLADGALLWRKCLLHPGQQDCSQAPVGVPVNDMQSNQSIVIISDFSGDVTARSLRTGDQMWKIEAPRRGGPAIAVDNGAVYLDHFNADAVQIWAVDLKTGVERWRWDVEDIIDRLAARENAIYHLEGVGDKSRAVAITQSGRDVLWQVPYHGGYGGVDNYLLLDNDTLFVVGTELVSIKVQDGKVLWRVNDMAGLKEPVVSGDILLVRDDHFLYALNKHTGVEIGRLSLSLAPDGNSVEINPAVSGDLVLIPISAKQIAAYRLKISNQ